MTQLRRGRGVEWCAAGAHWVPEGRMRAREGREIVRLETCRDCQLGNRGSSRAKQAEMSGRVM